MHLLYLTFGDNIYNHTQAQFSICSFLTRKEELKSINIITDRPEFYKNVESYVDVINVDENLLNEWKGPYNFFWRIKIKAIEMICDKYKNEPVVYLDSDTFLFQNFAGFRQKLLDGSALMHEREGKLSAAKSKTEKKMWSQVKNMSFGNININDKHAMWNAGVVATPNQKDNYEMQLALQICDEMSSKGVTPRLIEQFALSVALQETYGLNAAEKCIAHYWSNKDAWNKSITEFFVTGFFNGLTLEQLTTSIAKFKMDELPVKLRTRNTKMRLQKLVENLYPDQQLSFINRQQDI